MKIERKLRGRDGFSLVSTIIALGIGTIALVGMIDLILNLSRDQKRMNILFQLQQTQKNLSTLVANDEAWGKIVLNNSSLDCLKSPVGTFTPPPCNNGTTGNVSLFTAGGSPYFDPALQGFTLDGEICLQTEPRCKITMAINTEITCPGTPTPDPTCASPDQVVVTGIFQPFSLSAGNVFNFNPKNFKLNVRKDSVLAAGAGAGGGVVLQIKCGWVSGLGGVFYNRPTAGCLTSGGGPSFLFCNPNACPVGYNDAGVNSEYLAPYGVGHVLGNCIRTCLK